MKETKRYQRETTGKLMYKKFKESRQENLGFGSTVQNIKISTVRKTKTQSNSNQDLISSTEAFMLMRK